MYWRYEAVGYGVIEVWRYGGIEV
jgi:hypothetical protein